MNGRFYMWMGISVAALTAGFILLFGQAASHTAPSGRLAHVIFQQQAIITLGSECIMPPSKVRIHEFGFQYRDNIAKTVYQGTEAEKDA